MWYDRGVTEWGVSAVGSAQHWQCWGQGFESPTLHQTDAQSAFQPFQKNNDPHLTGAGRCSFLFLLRKKSLQSVPAVFAAAGSRVISPTRMPGKRPSHRGKKTEKSTTYRQFAEFPQKKPDRQYNAVLRKQSYQHKRRNPDEDVETPS